MKNKLKKDAVKIEADVSSNGDASVAWFEEKYGLRITQEDDSPAKRLKREALVHSESEESEVGPVSAGLISAGGLPSKK